MDKGSPGTSQPSLNGPTCCRAGEGPENGPENGLRGRRNHLMSPGEQVY